MFLETTDLNICFKTFKMSGNYISGLQAKLQDDLLSNTQDQDSIAFLNRLLFTQHETDARTLRKKIITENKRVGSDDSELATYSDIIREGKYQTDVILKNTIAEHKRPRRQSVNFHSIPDVSKEVDNDDENLSQLKHRLLQGHKAPEVQSFDQQLQSEESKQEDLLSDMLQLVTGIKEGASAFNEKLNEDQNVMKAVEAGLNTTSDKLQKSRKNLSKTIQNLGLLDSLKIFGVVLLLFFLSLIIIKIFPKW